MTAPTSTPAVHLLIECLGCAPAVLDDAAALSHALTTAARAIGANIVTTAFHRFSPQGVTGFVLLEESHISIHTWPERGYAAIDLFTCAPSDPADALPLLRALLSANRVDVLRVERGLHAEERSFRVREA